MQNKQSLYERLGGSYRIAAIVDDFIDRMSADPRLNANPRLAAASHRDSAAGFKYLVTEMVCWATGGPQVYTGRSMAESHRHLGISEDEWNWFVDDLARTLDKFEVGERERSELFALLDRSKREVVAPPR
ncbi:MAG: group 1 truncated hemoglobin [Candidatus Eremiobacteraeota bacterium]|nr:group 1 truncated hemoglobin [Candidatus Eremiobacteraeota bacterium]